VLCFKKKKKWIDPEKVRIKPYRKKLKVQARRQSGEGEGGKRLWFVKESRVKGQYTTNDSNLQGRTRGRGEGGN